jgi:hypothetical protein
MEPIVEAFANALVAAMATDTWKQARSAVAALWSRLHPPRRTENIEPELDRLREEALAARRAAQPEVEQALAATWQARLNELVRDNPRLLDELRHVLAETLAPLLSPADRVRIGQITMTGISSGNSTFNPVVGDQYNIYQALPVRPTVTSTLPADTAAFTGRDEQLEQIRTAAITAAETGRVVAIHAIDGMPGVGKTTLAIHVAHMVADQFPDRQLFVDLRAHTPGQRPADPGATLGALIAADGFEAGNLPDDTEGRAALWRARMAGKRILLILDNAASSDQAAPLLPGTAGSLVLITSRRYLGDLPAAVPMALDTLPPRDAQAMFTRLAPRAGAEQERVLEMVTLCGCLPLAITLLAGLFGRHPSWTMDNLISETRAKLLTVKAENRTVAATFQLSYQYLTAEQQQFFRYLGLHPGPDIDPYAAAALTVIPLEEASQRLDELHGDRLLAEPTPHRYRIHNLVQQYAHALATADDPADNG